METLRMDRRAKIAAGVAGLFVGLGATTASALDINMDNVSGGPAAGDGSGELFFSVWDTGRTESFILDIGLTVGDFVANGNTFGYNFSVTSPELAEWIGGGDAANQIWNIGGVNNSAIDSIFTLSTVDPTDMYVAPPGNNVIAAQASANQYVGAANSGAPADQDYGIFTVADGLAYFGGGAWGDSWGVNYAFDNAPSVGGGPAEIWQSTAIDADNSDSLLFGGTWDFDASTGTVAYTGIIPVPAAVWLFGSALGLLGVIRRRAARA